MINWLRGSKKNRKEMAQSLMELPEVNIQEWISAGQQAELEQILRNPILRMAIRIVAESMPIPMPSNVSKESDIIFAAGVTAGYAHCLENLRKLAVTETTKEPEATFEKQY
jgi:hypothetical protein